jgi:Tfp pilus assembly protein PilF
MLGPSGIAKIVDFGIARMDNAQTSTPTGFVVGTAAYMAPEQFTASALDGRADQYSLAAVGYEMMAGSTMFGEQPLPVLAYKAVHEMPAPVTTRNAAVPAAVDGALSKALAKSPHGRYTTCVEFVDALAVALSSPVVRSAPAGDRVSIPLPGPAIAASPKRSNAGRWTLAFVAIIAIAGSRAIWKQWVQSLQPVAVNTTATPSRPSTTTPVVPPVTQPPAQPDQPVKSLRPEPSVKRPVSEPLRPVLPIVKEETRKPPPSPPTPEPKPEPTASKTGPMAEAFRRGQQQLKAGEYQAAIESFTTVIAQQPKRAQAYYNRGQAHQLLMENEAAVRDYDEAIRLKPEDALPYAERGVCLVRLHRDDEAFASFNRALEIRADFPVALNGRGGVLLRRKQYENAIRDFTAAISFNPRMAVAYRNRAAAKQALGDKAGAAEDRKAAGNLKNGEP